MWSILLTSIALAATPNVNANTSRQSVEKSKKSYTLYAHLSRRGKYVTYACDGPFMACDHRNGDPLNTWKWSSQEGRETVITRNIEEFQRGVRLRDIVPTIGLHHRADPVNVVVDGVDVSWNTLGPTVGGPVGTPVRRLSMDP